MHERAVKKMWPLHMHLHYTVWRVRGGRNIPFLSLHLELYHQFSSANEPEKCSQWHNQVDTFSILVYFCFIIAQVEWEKVKVFYEKI